MTLKCFQNEKATVGNYKSSSGNFKKNAINDVKQISLSHVINERNFNLIINNSCLFSSNM